MDCEQRTCSADLIFRGDKHRVLKARFRGLGVVSAILRNLFVGSRLRDRCYDDSPQLFRKPFGANPSVFLTSGESSFGDLYIEGHGVGPAGVLDDELVQPVIRGRDLNRTLRSGASRP
jgi:hypothetical protein